MVSKDGKWRGEEPARILAIEQINDSINTEQLWAYISTKIIVSVGDQAEESLNHL